MAKVFLTIHEVMKMTNASDATIYDNVSRGNLPAPVRRKGTNAVGKRMIMNHWRREDVEALINSGKLRPYKKKKREVSYEALDEIVRVVDRDPTFWYLGFFMFGVLFGLFLPELVRVV